MKNPKDFAAPVSDEVQMQQAIQVLHFAQITNDYQQLVKNTRRSAMGRAYGQTLVRARDQIRYPDRAATDRNCVRRILSRRQYHGGSRRLHRIPQLRVQTQGPQWAHALRFDFYACILKSKCCWLHAPATSIS
jgi:hypothetical protein